MFNENIKTIRKSKGLSQEELAIKLNVVRQTISKWEKGLSVPDSEMLISISEILETPVSILLGQNILESQVDELKVISEKLEVINLQLSHRKRARRRALHCFFLLLCGMILVLSVGLITLNGTYLSWDFNNPEIAVVGTAIHGFEWLFIRLAPFLFLCGIIGVIYTRKKE